MRVVSLLVTLLVLVGCRGNTVQGTWDLTFTSDDPKISRRLIEVAEFDRKFRFDEDGRFWFTYGGQEAQGSYDVDGQTVTLSGERSDGTRRTDKLTWDRDNDTISGTIGKLQATLTRVD